MHVSGRDNPDNVNTIGFFADVLLLRMEVTGEESFKSLVDSVIQEFCAAYEHRSHWRFFSETDIPNVEKKSGGTCFNWTSRSCDELAGCPAQGIVQQLEGEISVERFPCEIPRRFPQIDEPSPFAVGFIWMYPGSVITGSLGYNTSILSKAAVEILMEHLKVAIKRFSEDPEQRISSGLSEFRRGMMK
jgi:non-ribosomal peptide synthetase component F